MADFCIISEFNPMHNGHKYIVEKARELGADSVSVVMSGNATQRGELAVTDKYLRGKAAVMSGVDLALELPYPWCASSADYFATAGAYIASQVADTLLFGSECGDIDLLCRAAEYCERAEFLQSFEDKKKIMGAAKAYVQSLEEAGFETLHSNDLLGVAYIRAVRRMGLDLECRTVKRVGSAYSDTEVRSGELPSATAIRRLLACGELDTIGDIVPRPTAEMLKTAIASGELVDPDKLLEYALCFFRLSDASAFEEIAEAGGGLANRICSVAKDSHSGAELFDSVRTKRYTDARVRRAMLFCMTGVKAKMLDTLPQYTTLLAANAKGRELLAKNRKSGGIEVVTKPADAPRDTEQYGVSERLDALYGLALPQKTTVGEMLRKKAYIEIGEKT